MSVKSILPFGDPILRKIAKPVTEINERTIKLLNDMAKPCMLMMDVQVLPHLK